MMESLHLARKAILGLLAAAGLCACTSRGSKPMTVLRSEDFIADPATLPTAVPASPPEATVQAPIGVPKPRPVFTVDQAREGVKDVSIAAGAPPPPLAGPFQVNPPSESMSLVDAKIGEINGRPIRVEDMLETEGPRLEQTAKTRRMSENDWKQAGRWPRRNYDDPCTRSDWRALAGAIFRTRLDSMLRDEVLSAEARAGLKPNEQLGLRAWVREAGESRRRASGGSKAELDRQLREKNQTEGRWSKDIETTVLIQTQIEDKFKARLKTSWKDIRLFYQRNEQKYRPPPQARFRQIQVAADDADAIATVRDGLKQGKSFIEIASLKINGYNAEEGGLFPDRPITGTYAQGDFFAAPDLNDAARLLKPGTYTPEPIERIDQAGKKSLTWLWLEAIIDNSRPLSDPNVQMEIAKILDDEALNTAVAAYITRLKERASFTDIDTMTGFLVEIASERYWPAGS